MSLVATEHTFTGSTTPIASYDSTKTNLGTLMVQKSGLNPEDKFAGPLPVAVARPLEESTGVAMMFPHSITFSTTIDWVFLLENSAAASATRRIFLYEYDKTQATYNWRGFITATLATSTAHTLRGFRALRYLHTTGTVAVAAPASVYSTGTIALAVTGIVTGTGTTFAVTHVGLMIGFGSTNVAQINCWYPIITFTNTTSITVSGASNAIAAGTAFVIASCTVTGSSTLFTTDLIAAGTNATAVAGGLGPRIGFGSTDPTQITNWYHIGSIASNTSLNITTSPGVIAAGTSYVIEELRFVITATNATATNGGLHLLKGAGYFDFTTAGTTFPAIASAVDNQRGVYWLCDAGAGAVTNTAASGCAIESETNKQTHYAYVLDGVNTTNSKIYKYNLRANNTVASGKMQLAGANIVITGTQAVTGTIPAQSSNNGIIATASHGPGSGSSYLYFITLTRLYCVDVSQITGSSTTYISAGNIRQEIPPSGISTIPASANMMNIEYLSSIDRFVITTYASGAGYRQYVTKYPTTDTTPFDHVFGVDDKQQDQSLASSQGAVHFNTGSQLLTVNCNNGVVHIVRGGTTAALNQMYALPFGAHWTYASSTSQRIITPSISTTGCVKFDQVMVIDQEYIGSGELKLAPESFRIYYRTSNINVNATSSWSLLGDDGDLSSVSASSSIQFMFEFFTIGISCVPSRIMSVIVSYENGSTDSHYQLSTTLSSINNERFAWRFVNAFGSTVPILKIELFNADDNSTLLTDDTDTPTNGTWEKSTDGGSNWSSYNTTDRTNTTTYIRYTPSSPLGNVRVRALLTQN